MIPCCWHLVVVIIVILGNEEVVLFQERGKVLADPGTDGQSRHNSGRDLKEQVMLLVKYGRKM